MVTLFWKTNVLITVITCLYATDGANILGIFPMPSKSHMTIHSVLMKELARRGHQVTVFSPFPEKSPIPNYTDIEFKLSYHKLRKNSGEHNTHFLIVFCIRFCKILKSVTSGNCKISLNHRNIKGLFLVFINIREVIY